MTQQYSLRWNNHQPNFISMFTTLLNTQTLVDVTLAAEGKHLQAHKVVLSACSTYFQALFVDNPSRHPIVILKDVSFADLRTMVDFMYYGEVNVTEEQLPQVLDTAKTLKIKGLTEMPDSTSLTRSQGTSADFPTGDPTEPPRHASSPANSPRRKRRRRSSTGSTQMNVVGEEGRGDEAGPSMDLVRGDAITLSSVPQRRARDYHDERLDAHQTTEPQNLNVELTMESDASGIQQGGQWSMMEHTYPRYSSACLGGALQPDGGLYANSVMGAHMGGDMGEYAQALSEVGPSPGPSCAVDPTAPPDPPPSHAAAAVPPPKRRRTANPQSEENFQRALEAVRFGGIGFCKAARMFGVNNRTLWLEYKKKGYPNNRPSIKSRIKRAESCGQTGLKLRRSKYFKRQNRVQPDEPLRKQTSEPAPSAHLPLLQKHESYPQYSPHKHRRIRTQDHEVGTLFIRAVTVLDRQSSSSSGTPSTSIDLPSEAPQTTRASHTPAVRSGPPLSCNFCWNTVDECGRILRRKTQYHCPECRTNLCIVPCFHEYHDGPEPDAAASAR